MSHMENKDNKENSGRTETINFHIGTQSRVEEVVRFWFGASGSDPRARQEMWWGKSPEADQEIRSRFLPLVQNGISGELGSWQENDARSCLALIIVLDQFTRQIWRGDPEAFSGDKHALRASIEGLKKGFDLELGLFERWFFYMPLEHAEDCEIQRLSVEKLSSLCMLAPEDSKQIFEEALRYAIRHREIIDRFGRFPHRNAQLGRPSTEEEMLFLKTPGSSF